MREFVRQELVCIFVNALLKNGSTNLHKIYHKDKLYFGLAIFEAKNLVFPNTNIIITLKFLDV